MKLIITGRTYPLREAFYRMRGTWSYSEHHWYFTDPRAIEVLKKLIDAGFWDEKLEYVEVDE